MKFRITNEPTEEVVNVHLERQGENVAVFLGKYAFITLLPNGTVCLNKFWRNSPMHDLCVKHQMKLTTDAPQDTRLRLALTVKS